MLRDSLTASWTAITNGHRDHRAGPVRDSINKQLERELTGYMVEHPGAITRALNLMTWRGPSSAWADHATNIAEEVFYLYKGQDIRHEPSRAGRPAGGGEVNLALPYARCCDAQAIFAGDSF